MKKEGSQKDSKLGLVTAIDRDFIYVWGRLLDFQELRYPLRAIPGINPGDVVRFCCKEDKDAIQSVDDLVRADDVKLPVQKLMLKDYAFKVKTTIMFPPDDYLPYQECVHAVQECHSIAWSSDFGKVAVFRKLNYKVGTVYEAFIGRIPRMHDRLVPLVGTLFTFLGANLVEVEDQHAALSKTKNLPWEQLDTHRINDGNKYVHAKFNELSEKTKNLSIERSSVKNVSCVGEKSNFVDSEYTGIVVRNEREYAVIWNKSLGLVLAPQADYYQLATWVEFQCFEDKPAEGGKITKCAYEIREIDPLLTSMALELTVQVEAKLRLNDYQTKKYPGLFETKDDILGPVLCSDQSLIRRLASGEVIEAFAFFLEDYASVSNWVAFAIHTGNNAWEKMSSLPERVNELADMSFDLRGKSQEDAYMYENVDNQAYRSRSKPVDVKNAQMELDRAAIEKNENCAPAIISSSVQSSSISPCLMSLSEEELSLYNPDLNEKKARGLGIVVKRGMNYALIYSMKRDVCLLKAADFSSFTDQFENDCQPGNWMKVTFVKTVEVPNQPIRYKYMCFPKIELVAESLPTKVLMDFVQVEVDCEFNNDTVSRCEEDMTKVKVKCDLGLATISDTLYKKHELHDTSRSLWLTYIKQKNGCSWKINIPSELNIPDS